MGLFDLFKGKSKDGEKKSNPAAKWAEAAGSKRAQTYERQEAIQELAAIGTPEAVTALLKRFTFNADPSITDEEEKELAFKGILKAGKEAAIEPVRAFAMKAESVGWPIRIVKELLSEEELVDELLVWLGKWDTDYAKFIDPKLQLLKELGERVNPKIRPAVERFLEDVSDPARFDAVVAVLKQEEPEALGPLLKLMLEEESTRIRSKIADGLVALGWTIPEDQREPVRKVLPPQYGIDGSGLVTKRG